MKKAGIVIIIAVVLAGGALLAQWRLSSSPAINVTAEQINAFLKELPPEQIAQFRENPKGKEEFVKAIRQLLTVGQEAERRGITDQPDTKNDLDFAYMNILVRLWKQTDEGKKVKIEQKDIDQFYKDKPTAFDDFVNRTPKIKSQPGYEGLKNTYAEMCISRTYAEKAGIANKPEFQLMWLINKAQLVGQKVFPELEKQVQISDQDVKTYYEANKADFEEVKASHILVSTRQQPPAEDGKEGPKPPTKEEARKKAEDILKQVKEGGDFAKLAEQYSDDPGSKVKGGDLGFFKKKAMVPTFADAAFALKPGEISGIVESPFGFHIIKVMDRRQPAIDKPLDAEIREQLKGKKIEELIDALAQKDRVTVATNFEFPKDAGDAKPE